MSAELKPVRYTEAGLVELLRARYPREQYVLIPSVRSRTGAVDCRTADAITVGLWPSRGIEVEGFECKVSRSDWLRELKNAEKAEEICRYCDRWWIVVADKAIVHDGELPPTWGLMAVSGGKLRMITPAPKLTPSPLSRGFVAAMLRRMDQVSAPDDALEAARIAGRAEGRQLAEKDDRHARKVEQLRQAIDGFEKASGVKLSEWGSNEKIGEAVAVVLAGKHLRVRSDLENLIRTAERIAESGKRALQEDILVNGELFP